MINLNYSFWSIILLFTYIYIEIFISIINYSIFKNTKNFFLNISKKYVSNLNIKNLFYFYLNLILIYLLFLKVSYEANYILSIVILYICILNLFKKYINYDIHFLMFNIIFFLILFQFINSFIIFFLFIELYSIIFYFFFITYNQSKVINVLQYKNLLLLYLFNNFFSTISYLLGIYFIVYYYGTLNFTELTYLTMSPNLSIYFIILSFILKLSLPGFHFLKIEIYKYLPIDIIIVYSVITLILNYLFMVILFNQPIIYINLNAFKFFNLLILVSIIIFIQKIKLNNFHEFIAYSGFSTNILIIINYII